MNSSNHVQDSEERLLQIVDSIPGLVVLLTAEGQVEFVNRKGLEYFGKTLEELKSWQTAAMEQGYASKCLHLKERRLACRFTSARVGKTRASAVKPRPSRKLGLHSLLLRPLFQRIENASSAGMCPFGRAA